MSEDFNIEVIEGEPCPFCHKKTLTLRQAERDIPYFGHAYLFSMDCDSCHYHKSDVELESSGEPVKYELKVESEEDLKIRIVKSSHGLIKIPRVGSIEPGEAANGYITNVEGIINRIKHQIEFVRDNSDDDADRKKAKNLIKKLQRVLWGQEQIKIILEDPTGNSAIISDKALKK